MISDYDLFRRIVSSGSLSAAARQLRISPSTVSKRLAGLEARLGAPLITRSTRKLVTTDVGQVFYEEVSEMLTRIASAEARVSGQAEYPCGKLRIAAPISFGRTQVAPFLGRFLKENEGVEVELFVDDDYIDLFENRIDVAIRITMPPGDTYDCSLLARNNRILCAAPSYIAKFGYPTDYKELKKHQLLAATHQSCWRLQGPGGSRILDVNSRIVTNCSDVVREATVAGLGIALRSTWDIAGEIKKGRLVRILPRWQGDQRVGIFAIRPKSSLVPMNVKVFIQFMKLLYEDPPYWERGIGLEAT